MSDRNETPHLILQELGLKKCNGDVNSATENITIEQIKSVVGKQKSKLTGSDISAMCREVMGTCVAMRIKVEGMHAREAIKATKEEDKDNLIAIFSFLDTHIKTRSHNTMANTLSTQAV